MPVDAPQQNAIALIRSGGLSCDSMTIVLLFLRDTIVPEWRH
jgi:hypothetical protein